MKTRKLGYTDLSLTTVGLGTWAIGGPWQFGWGPQDDKQAVDAILSALDQGINWIDTAPIYGLGHAEELIAKALEQISEKPIIATKCGLLWNEKREKVNSLKKNSIKDECHASLRRLGIETIDLYQIHWPEPDEDLEQAWEQMAELAEQGKVRYLGLSNCSQQQIERLAAIHPVASLQPPYSMIRRDVEDNLLDYCRQKNIGVITYSPMQKGLLTGKFSHKYLQSLAPDDHRLKDPDFQEPKFSATIELVTQLAEIAHKYDATPAQLAISWVLRRPELTAAIVGAGLRRQIKETARASEINLADEDIEKIELFLKKRQEKIND